MKRTFDTFNEKDNTFVFPGDLTKPLFNLGGIFAPAADAPVAPVAPVAPNVKTICKKRKQFTPTQRDKYWKHWYGDVNEAVCFCCEERRLRRYQLRGWSLGHDIAFSIGGSDHVENVIPICGQCNDEMGNEYTVMGYKLAYFYDNEKLYKSTEDVEWFIKAFDHEKVKTVRDLREAYRECGAFDKRNGDFLSKDYYKKFEVTYKGTVLKEHEFLPHDTDSDHLLAEISV